ncbi:MAG: hypothetical protein PHI59_03075 [Candidatus Omnitrophica bacterium]|nr:hypothetical protein [Candidatus Omnitrophota bacterium]
MKNAVRIPAILLSVIIISTMISLVFADSYQQSTRTKYGRCEVSTTSEDRSFYNVVGTVCIGQPLSNYKRKSCLF